MLHELSTNLPQFRKKLISNQVTVVTAQCRIYQAAGTALQESTLELRDPSGTPGACQNSWGPVDFHDLQSEKVRVCSVLIHSKIDNLCIV